MSTVYHEQNLSESTQDIHRALTSLTEELEATDWYNQRMDATADPGLRDILEHNRNEEIEHASMLLEYLRRTMPAFDEQLRTYLFTSAPITQIEDAEEGGEGEGEETEAPGSGDLGIGTLT